VHEKSKRLDAWRACENESGRWKLEMVFNLQP
jgi:hypothetical protein